ncbi:MAG: hypothetical protein Q9173_005168 [Seirophora scorigena]
MLEQIITKASLLASLLASHYLISPVTALPPFRNHVPVPATCLTAVDAPVSAPLANLSTILTTPTLKAHENFIYPIPRTSQVLRGRLFTCRPVPPVPLQRLLAGALSRAQARLSFEGPNARLLPHDNPFVFEVAGCHFEMYSRRARDGLPDMTWKMMRDAIMALQQVMERPQNAFEAGFLLMEEGQGNWGNGQVLRELPGAQMSVA